MKNIGIKVEAIPCHWPTFLKQTDIHEVQLGGIAWVFKNFGNGYSKYLDIDTKMRQSIWDMGKLPTTAAITAPEGWIIQHEKQTGNPASLN